MFGWLQDWFSRDDTPWTPVPHTLSKWEVMDAEQRRRCVTCGLVQMAILKPKFFEPQPECTGAAQREATNADVV